MKLNPNVVLTFDECRDIQNRMTTIINFYLDKYPESATGPVPEDDRKIIVQAAYVRGFIVDKLIHHLKEEMSNE